MLTELFTGEVRKVFALIKKLEQRRLTTKADATDDVVNIVAIQAAGSGEQNIVVTAFRELMTFENSRRRRSVFRDRNKLEEMVAEVEQSGRCVVGDRDRHPPFACG